MIFPVDRPHEDDTTCIVSTELWLCHQETCSQVLTLDNGMEGTNPHIAPNAVACLHHCEEQKFRRVTAEKKSQQNTHINLGGCLVGIPCLPLFRKSASAVMQIGDNVMRKSPWQQAACRLASSCRQIHFMSADHFLPFTLNGIGSRPHWLLIVCLTQARELASLPDFLASDKVYYTIKASTQCCD